MKIANSIWIHDLFPVKESFIKDAERNFDSIAENRDFDAPATLKEINAWIEEKTGGTIKDFLDQLSSDTGSPLSSEIRTRWARRSSQR